MTVNNLALPLHRLLTEKKDNVFFSPFSVSTAMAMVYLAAEGETEAEMKKVLGFTELSKDYIVSGFEQIQHYLAKNNDSCTLSSANFFLSRKGFEIKDLYKSVLKESFKALLLEADLQHDSEKAVKQINEWVKGKTNDKIPEIITSLEPNVVMVLLNAVYFKGNWLHKFDEARTSSETFYNKGDKDKTKSIKMMHMKEYFLLAEEDSFQAIQLPYAGKEVAMLILLPREIDGLEALEGIITPSFIQDLSPCMIKREVRVALPRFRLEYSVSLKESFERLGVVRLFQEGAELGGASDSESLLVSKIEHKAVLEVNEEGSEAAAATAIKIQKKCSRPVRKFTVDHPFAFAIYDVKSNLILFMGRVVEL